MGGSIVCGHWIPLFGFGDAQPSSAVASIQFQRADKVPARSILNEVDQSTFCNFLQLRSADKCKCGQAVEHYEITRYGSMRGWATSLGMEEAAELIESILGEEKGGR